MARPPAPALLVSTAERAALQEIAESVSRPHRAVREAKGLLMAAEGIANTKIASALGVSRSTVIGWREHFEQDGVNWVGKVHEGRGRKPVIDKAVIDKMIEDTRTTTPPAATHWSNRTMAAHSGLSRTTVQREWKARGLKPHLVKTFKVSNDPHFEDKLIDVVGLSPPPTSGSRVARPEACRHSIVHLTEDSTKGEVQVPERNRVGTCSPTARRLPPRA